MTTIPWSNKRQDSPAGESSPLGDLRTEVDRLFESWVREPLERAGRSLAGGGFSPAVDVAETADAVIVRAEVPGVDPGRLDITVTGDTLIVAGEKPAPRDEPTPEARVSQRAFGAFRRAIQLPSAVDADRVTAECRHGVLTIQLPISTKAPASKITVQPR